MDSKLRAEEITNILTLTAAKRVRKYDHISAFSIRFEADDTGAASSAGDFRSLVKTFGLSDIDECVIPAGCLYPATKVGNVLEMHLTTEFSRCSQTPEGRCLAIIHYAGHARYDECDGLFFDAGPIPGHFPFSSLTSRISEFHASQCPPFDVVFIIDSYYAGGASLQYTPRRRETVELLAAVSEDSTFTSKLANEAALASAKMPSIDFIELLKRTYDMSVVKKPVHRFLAGAIPIRLRFAAELNASPPPSPTASLSVNSNYTVVIKCHVVDDPTSAGVGRLIKTIEDVQHSIGVVVDQVYPAESTGLVMRVPHSVFLSLETLSGIEVLFENVGRPIPVREVATEYTSRLVNS
ncbi:uncharacterized protein GIQ15_01203 [Arthroderma uncinatum]|uniref:uncharacterized protein n=1 Tax=Arthroderma uncinatum TaxID=74035 RepID=UPI00144A7249|nr:uncharacterized protein GIQ15_01203 [Arthroderma uncinatum]KAF3491686.1 hypothetical protein GIQ15_01203 [Arthroderma uncinatum]